MDTKLKLNKEVIATLNDDSMNRVEGGAAAKTYNLDATCASGWVPGYLIESQCICMESGLNKSCTCHDDM